jgi:hypothetical protein
MKVIAIISGIIFLLFTIVQFNDPDPLYWIFIYLLTSGFSLAVFFNRFYPRLMLLTIGMYLNAAFGLWAGVAEWFRSPDRSLLFDDIAKMQHIYIEEAREFLGLMIALAAMIYFYVKSAQQKV